MSSQEIYLKDHTFLPSIELSFSRLYNGGFENQAYKEVLSTKIEGGETLIEKIIPEKIFKYAKFNVNILRRGKLVGDPILLRSNLVLCTPEIFEAYGEGDKLSEAELNMRLCPDMDTIKDLLRVKNSYSDKNERVSFSIQAVACDQSVDKNCASTPDREEFFNEVYFTVYIL